MVKIEVEIPDPIWAEIKALATILKKDPSEYAVKLIESEVKSLVEEIIALS